MAEERFNVVSDRDTPLYTVEGKDKLHSLDALHRGIHVLVEVFGGRFLIQKKAAHTENGGKWSSAVSGHVRSTETYEKAAIREAKEELGIDISESELHFIARSRACKETGNELIRVFTYLLDPDNEDLTISDEIDEIIICSREDLIKDVKKNSDRYSPAFIYVFNIFLTLEQKLEAKNGL